MSARVAVLVGAMLLWACGTQNVPDGRLPVDTGLAPDHAPGAEGRVGDGPGSEAPPAPSFSGKVQPIFSASCGGGNCHIGASPTAPDLSPGKAFAALVNVHSTECPQQMQVKPGDPTQSYLSIKIAGSSVYCFKGTKMPPGGGLAASEASTIDAWITGGAPNN
jgi:hypothetical protein